MGGVVAQSGGRGAFFYGLAGRLTVLTDGLAKQKYLPTFNARVEVKELKVTPFGQRWTGCWWANAVLT